MVDRGAKVVLCSHLGRPKGKIAEDLRMGPIAARLSILLSKNVVPLLDSIGPAVISKISKMENGDVVLLENLRFYEGEEKNDPDFARSLSELSEVFVLDAFGAAHRAHASIVGVTSRLPSAAGLVLEKEISVIGGALQSPERPLAAILGGASLPSRMKEVFLAFNVSVSFLPLNHRSQVTCAERSST